jgi:D-alanyl-D-alanine carboxypeptidase
LAPRPAALLRVDDHHPLLFAPGTGYHYSNLGYDILGLIAERATGETLPVLFRQHIFRPLGLTRTAYDPNGPIQGPHAHGYMIAPNGTTTDTTDIHRSKGADGGIVSDAQDTATFLTALMRGRLLDRSELAGMKGENLWGRGRANDTVVDMCGSIAYGWGGAGEGFKTEAYVNGTGTRVAVLLLNARHPPLDGQTAFDTVETLYCGA